MFVVLSHSDCGGVLQRTISKTWGKGEEQEEAEGGREKEERA